MQKSDILGPNLGIYAPFYWTSTNGPPPPILVTFSQKINSSECLELAILFWVQHLVKMPHLYQEEAILFRI